MACGVGRGPGAKQGRGRGEARRWTGAAYKVGQYPPGTAQICMPTQINSPTLGCSAGHRSSGQGNCRRTHNHSPCSPSFQTAQTAQAWLDRAVLPCFNNEDMRQHHSSFPTGTCSKHLQPSKCTIPQHDSCRFQNCSIVSLPRKVRPRMS